jgi:hypothetical protein
MGQCQKILSEGVRCSDRAVPGTDFCDQHNRIQFRAVNRIEAPIPPPPVVEVPRAIRTTVTPPPKVIARPSAVGEQPTFPALRPDARSILVAPEGLIWLPRASTDQSAVNVRLARLLSCLSQEIALAGQVSVRLMENDAGALVSLRPAKTEQLDLSRFYDTASTAAGLCGGMLFIGQDRTFIRYRDADAPRGYNADALQTPARGITYLVDRDGTHALSHSAMQDTDLADLLLRISPVPAHSTEAPATLFVLAQPALSYILVRYFRDHYLSFRVAQLESGTGKSLSLLEVRSRPDSPTGARIMPHVLTYLCGLPHTLVCTAVESTSERRMLVQWQHKYPCLARNVIEVFKPDSLVLFTAGPYFSNMSVSPVPAFFEGDQLTSIRMMSPQPASLKPVDDWQSRRFELPVRLVSDSGPLLPTAALVLKHEQIDWVRRLLHKLPAEAFADYTLSLGEDAAVLLATTKPLESLPFGIPFRRIEDTNLFIPIRTRFVPDLPWALLAGVLGITDEAYTFFAESFRLDVPGRSFAPISRALVAETNPPRLDFKLRTGPVLPDLKWVPPPRPEGEGRSVSATREQLRAIRENLNIFRRSRPSPASRHDLSIVRRGTSAADADILFKERAELFLKSGDWLSAALCFALAGDNYNAAQHYQAAARQIRDEKRKE